MLRRFVNYVLLPVVAIAFASAASAAEISAQYLDGVWTLDEEQNCGLQEFEHITFRPDGTFQGERFGVVNSTGFWRSDGDFIQAHLVASPAHFDDRLQAFTGVFDYFLIKMITFNHQPDRFEAVGTIGDEMRKVSLVRCKKYQ